MLIVLYSFHSIPQIMVKFVSFLTHFIVVGVTCSSYVTARLALSNEHLRPMS